MSDPRLIDIWAQGLVTLHDLLSRLEITVRDMAHVPDAPAEQRLAACVQLWRQLRLPSVAQNTAPGQLARDQAHVWAEAARGLPQAWSHLAGVLSDAIRDSLQAGFRHEAILCPADFGDGLSYLELSPPQTEGSGFAIRITAPARYVALGLLSALPPAHPLLTKLSHGDALATAGGPSVVLGVCDGTSLRPIARPWYDLEGSLLLTGLLRRQQTEAEERAAAERRHQDAQRAEANRLQAEKAKKQDVAMLQAELALVKSRLAEVEGQGR
jgi:hypothetical protein